MNIDKIDLDERIKYFENHLDEAQIIMTASLEQFIKTFHYIQVKKLANIHKIIK